MDSQGQTFDQSIQAFWQNFSLLPGRFNLLIKKPAIPYLAILFPYLVILMVWLVQNPHPLPPSATISQSAAWRNLIGYLFISLIELHIVVWGIILSAWAYLHWTKKIQPAFNWLLYTDYFQTNGAQAESQKIAFLRDYQRELKNRKGIGMFIIVMEAFLILTMVLFRADYLAASGPPGSSNPGYMPINLLIYLSVIMWALFGALGSWSIYVTARHLKHIDKWFTLKMQPSHPDRCGGLKPVGSFCFDLALPLFIGGIMFAILGIGGLLLLSTGVMERLYSSFSLDFQVFNASFVYGSTVFLFVVVTPLTAFTYFAPLSGIHQLMLKSKREAEDAFAVRVADLENIIRTHTTITSEIEQAKAAKERLEILQVVNPEKTGFPVWPFRPSLVIKLFSPQIVSAVGFILSIYKVFAS